jgi:hypothetical protein
MAAVALVVAGVVWAGFPMSNETAQPPTTVTPSGSRSALVSPSPTTSPTPSASTNPTTSPESARPDRYPDGIPSQIAGEKVLRLSDLQDLPELALGPSEMPEIPELESGSARRYLVAGWSAPEFVAYCLAAAARFSRLVECPKGHLTDKPGGHGPGGYAASAPLPKGPVVVRTTIQVSYPSCPPGARCAISGPDLRLHVLQVVWTGDAVTGGSPRTMEGVVEALTAKYGSLVLHAQRPETVTCDPGYPPVVWRTRVGESIARVIVFPSISRRRAVQPNIGSTFVRGTNCVARFEGTCTMRWVVVDNIMVAIRVSPAGATADQLLVVRAVRNILQKAGAP